MIVQLRGQRRAGPSDRHAAGAGGGAGALAQEGLLLLLQAAVLRRARQAHHPPHGSRALAAAEGRPASRYRLSNEGCETVDGRRPSGAASRHPGTTAGRPGPAKCTPLPTVGCFNTTTGEASRTHHLAYTRRRRSNRPTRQVRRFGGSTRRSSAPRSGRRQVFVGRPLSSGTSLSRWGRRNVPRVPFHPWTRRRRSPLRLR